jgi:hypothetical protein
MSELVGLIIGLLLTLFLYSYVWGDNPLYRLAIHLLVGVSAAYAAVVVIRQLFVPLYTGLQGAGGRSFLMWLIPIILGLLLLLKRLPRLAWMGTGTLALLVGVGAAVALMGALTGTLLPQVTAVSASSPWEGLLVALLTIAALLAFHFSGRRSEEGGWRPFPGVGAVAQVGQAVLMITFGALFANVLNTGLILLVERIQYFIMAFARLLS